MSKKWIHLAPIASFLLTGAAASLQAQAPFTRQVPNGGTVALTASGEGFAFNGPEFDDAFASDADEDGDTSGDAVHIRINRSFSHSAPPPGMHRMPPPRPIKPERPLPLDFDGLDFYQQRFADGGNQFSTEPPDQALCVGNGYVLESTNDVLRVYNAGDGSPAAPAVSLNKFYGYISAVDRSSGTAAPVYGPAITDPSCTFDQKSRRWFHVALTFERVGTTVTASGKSHLDLAVSNTPNPLGSWTIYRIPDEDNGTEGTPDHHCTGGFCFGDFPRLGADDNGIYITTNEFASADPGFYGAQIYAISKRDLVNGAASIKVAQYDTGGPSPASPSASGLIGVSLRPALSAGDSPSILGGTEFFINAPGTLQPDTYDTRLQLWSLTGTGALNSGGAPALTNSVIDTESYVGPAGARQPGTRTDGVGLAPGGGNIDFPLGQCLNSTSCIPNLQLGKPETSTEVISTLSASDSRVQQVFYADGKLWASLGTGGLSYDGVNTVDGIAYFILQPSPGDHATPTATVLKQDYVADPAMDLIYGTVAVTNSGKGVISFTDRHCTPASATSPWILKTERGISGSQRPARECRTAEAGTPSPAAATSPVGEITAPPRSTEGLSGLPRNTSGSPALSTNTSLPPLSVRAGTLARSSAIGEHASSRSCPKGIDEARRERDGVRRTLQADCLLEARLRHGRGRNGICVASPSKADRTHHVFPIRYSVRFRTP